MGWVTVSTRACGYGRSVEMTQREGCQAGVRALLQPAASRRLTSFLGDFPRGQCLPRCSSQRARESWNHRGSLHCITVLLHCCHTAGLQRQIWSRGDGFTVCVEVSGKVQQLRTQFRPFDLFVYCTEIISISKKSPPKPKLKNAAPQYLKSIFQVLTACLNPRELNYIIPPLGISGLLYPIHLSRPTHCLH